MTSLRLVGGLLTTTDEHAEARVWFEKALSQANSLVSGNPDVPKYRVEQMELLVDLFHVEMVDGNALAAQAALQKARESVAQLIERFPGHAHHQHWLAVTLLKLAKKQQSRGDANLANDDLSEAHRILKQLVEQYPQQLEYVELLKETESLMGVSTVR